MIEAEGVTFVPSQRPAGVPAENVPGGWLVTLPSGRQVRWIVGLGHSTSTGSRWRLVDVQVGQAPPPAPAQPEPLLSAAELAAMNIRDMTPDQVKRRDLLIALGEIVVVAPSQPDPRPEYESTSTRRFRAYAEFDQRPETAEWATAAHEALADEKARTRL